MTIGRLVFLRFYLLVNVFMVVILTCKSLIDFSFPELGTIPTSSEAIASVMAQVVVRFPLQDSPNASRVIGGVDRLSRDWHQFRAQTYRESMKGHRA